MEIKEDPSMATRQNQALTAGKPKFMPASSVTGLSPTIEERVRLRAYRLFEERQHTGIPGTPAFDWLRAECEVNAASR
jgi:hypothetical protein